MRSRFDLVEAGYLGADHTAFAEDGVRLDAGDITHAGGAHMRAAAGFERDVASEAAIDLDALVAAGLERAIELCAFGDQAGNGAQAVGGDEAGVGGVVAHVVRAPCCATRCRA